MSKENRLTDIIHQRMNRAGGSLPFEQFMQAALYEPGMGYYDTKAVFGEKGDFVTASELGPWLSLAMADLVFDAWQQMGEPDNWTLIEQGPVLANSWLHCLISLFNCRCLLLKL